MSEITISSILSAASNTGHNITEQQAKSILIRHTQLVKEGKGLSKEKQNQVDKCWRQREYQKLNE